MIRDHANLVGVTLEVNSPVSKCFDDGQEFLVVNLVVKFRWRHLSRQIGYGSQLRFVVRLAEACSDSFIRRIRFYRNWFLRIEDNQNRLGREARLQFLKRFLGLEIPFERLILLS